MGCSPFKISKSPTIIERIVEKVVYRNKKSTPPNPNPYEFNDIT